MRTIRETDLVRFEQELRFSEKAPATVEKYLRAVRRLAGWLAGASVTKDLLLEYRAYLKERCRAQTVNGGLTAINAFLTFRGWGEWRLRLLRVQRAAFLPPERELIQAEYRRLLSAARRQGRGRLHLLIQTLCATGIRISELQYITVEAAAAGRAEVSMKGKSRVILLQKALCERLMRYAGARGIRSGPVFCTRSGRPMDRSNVWREMKRLCAAAGVAPGKVFPHSFRHLFARTFYALEKDLAHLADILGHSRIETTRIYVAVSANAHLRVLERMHLLQ